MIKKYENAQQGTGLFTQITVVLLLLVLTGGCATVGSSGADGASGGKSGEDSTTADANAAAKAASSPVLPKPQPRPEDYPVAPFPEDTLYQLLVAEVAGYRGEYETALEKYVRIANETRDAGVAARATRLASYLKRPDLALQTAIIWADADPENLDAHRHAADLLMRSGDLEGAILHMEAVKNLGGLATFDIFAYRAANLDDEGREALLTAVSRMLERYPGDEQLTFAKAVLLEQKGQLEDSLALADQLLLADSNININVVILKVNTLKDLHRSSDAITFLGATIDDLATSNSSPRQDVLRRLRLIYARFLFEDKQLEQARAQYEIVHQQMPNDGDILFALALIGMEQGNDTSARDYLEQMIRWNRRVGEARYYLGSIAEKNEDFETALENYRQAGRGYEFLPSQGRIAHLLVEQGRIKEMQAHLANMRADVPDRADQLLMIEAQTFIERGMQTEAFAVMDAAVANDPGNEELLYFRAMAGEKFDRLDILERDLQAMIENDPDNADAMNALGYTLADKTDRFDEALEWIERALAIKPNEPAYIDSLGWVQFRLKDFDNAIENLRKALKMFPNDEVAAHLGEALWAVGNESEAQKIWEKFLEMKPDSEILKRVMDRFLSK